MPRTSCRTESAPPSVSVRSTTNGVPSTSRSRSRRRSKPARPTTPSPAVTSSSTCRRTSWHRTPPRRWAADSSTDVPGAHARSGGRRWTTSSHVDLRRVPPERVRRVRDRGRGAHVRSGLSTSAQPLQRRAGRGPDPRRRRGRPGTDPEPRGGPRRRARRGRRGWRSGATVPPGRVEGVHDRATARRRMDRRAGCSTTRSTGCRSSSAPERST